MPKIFIIQFRTYRTKVLMLFYPEISDGSQYDNAFNTSYTKYTSSKILVFPKTPTTPRLYTYLPSYKAPHQWVEGIGGNPSAWTRSWEGRGCTRLGNNCGLYPGIGIGVNFFGSSSCFLFTPRCGIGAGGGAEYTAGPIGGETASLESIDSLSCDRGCDAGSI